MARKPKKKPEGAPAWMVTYGDMVTLLLTFFVMLTSMANYEQVSERFMAAIQSIREALGMTGQVGNMVDTSVDFHSLIHKLESITKPNMPKKRGDAREEGIHGKNFRIRRIRDGMEITIGGPIVFEPFSEKLTEEGKDMISQVGDKLRGHRNKIEVRGHAGEVTTSQEWTSDDAMSLSYKRAELVRHELILRGVDEKAISIVACGGNEPVVHDTFDPTKRSDNRRVEIVIRESLIDDYVGPKPLFDPVAQGPSTQPASQPSDAW